MSNDEKVYTYEEYEAALRANDVTLAATILVSSGGFPYGVNFTINFLLSHDVDKLLESKPLKEVTGAGSNSYPNSLKRLRNNTGRGGFKAYGGSR